MRFKLCCLLIFFSVLFLSKVTAQITLSGIVTDINETAIPYANVVLTDLKTEAFITGTTTGEDGAFSLTSSINVSVKISISFIGFETWNTIVNETRNFQIIKLSEAENKLQEVVISGFKPTVSKKGDQLIFNVQNSPLKEGYDGMEILKVTPNVWVDGNDAILIREQAARVLINGRRINMSGSELSNYLSNLTSENILRVEVQTNQSANTSAVSTGGILNIILKQPPLGLRGQLKSYYANRGGDYDIAYTGATLSYGRESWNVYGAYNIGLNETNNEIENVVQFNETGRLNTTIRDKKGAINRQNYQVGFFSSISKTQEVGVEVFGTTSNQDYNDFGAVTYRQNDQLVDSGRNDIAGTTNLKRFNSVFNYNWSIGKKDRVTLIADYLKSSNDGESDVINSYESGTVENSQNRYTPKSNTEVLAAQADYSKALIRELVLDLGIKYTRTDRFNSLLSEINNGSEFLINEAETTDFNYEENIAAAYVSASNTWKENNYLKAGLRIENTVVNKQDFITNTGLNQDYTSWFPSLYYSRTLGAKKSLSASYSRSLRRPSFRSLSDNIIKVNDFQFILGNPDLSPEFVSLFELSYDFKDSGLSAYYKDTSDAINGIYFIEDEIAFYKKFNAGAQVQYGLQFNTSKKITSWWYTRFSSHFYNRKFINEQGESSFEKATAGASIFNVFTINSTTSFDFSARYTSPKADAFYEAAELYTANITFKKSFIDKKLNLRIYFNDVFNTLQYNNIRQFDTFSTSAEDKPRSRRVMLWLTYNISNNKKVLSKKNTSKNDSSRRL